VANAQLGLEHQNPRGWTSRRRGAHRQPRGQHSFSPGKSRSARTIQLRRSFGPISSLCQHHNHQREALPRLPTYPTNIPHFANIDDSNIVMWSLGRQLLVGSLAVWSAAAELSFSAQSVYADGEVRALSSTDFLPVPPRQRWQHNAHQQNATWKETRDLVSHSGSWCGASQHSTPAEKIVNAYGSFTTPNLKLRKDLPAPQYAAAWVGIDGAECKQALLQAGVTTVVGRLSVAGRNLANVGVLGQLKWWSKFVGVVAMVPRGLVRDQHEIAAHQGGGLGLGQCHGSDGYRGSAVRWRYSSMMRVESP